MQIGDSITVPVPEGIPWDTVAHSLQGSYCSFAKRRAGYAFTRRVAADKKSVTVWRVNTGPALRIFLAPEMAEKPARRVVSGGRY